jgi:hypothetical protein
MKKFSIILLISFCMAPAIPGSPVSATALAATAAGPGEQAATATPKQDLTILPTAFAGWEISGGIRKGTEAAAVDHAQSAALREYGFTGYEIASYSQGKRKLTVRAARFQDATGAYGAFTFYRVAGMLPERIGRLAASDNERILFFRDNVLVEARFDRVTAMSAAELRELAAALPTVKGPATNLPPLPSYLPRDKIAPNSAKFVLGPAAYASLAVPIPDSVIDFSRGPEILTGKIAQRDTDATLLLIAYPTPQIAMERMDAMQKMNPAPDASYIVKRTGPIVKVVYGSIPPQDANSLLARINYQAEVTWNENTGLSKKDNIGSLVIAALTLAGIIFVFSLGTGAIFGFGRPLASKLFPRWVHPAREEGDFIRLNLRK